MPAGLALVESTIQRDLDRRRPGTSPYATSRQEPDKAKLLSGVTKDGFTNGAPIAIVVENTDAKVADYKENERLFRPGHADFTYHRKYGLNPQPGGGRASGRETLARVAAGAVARLLLASTTRIQVLSAVRAIDKIVAQKSSFEFAEKDPLRFLDPDLAPKAHNLVKAAQEKGDSLGGVVEVQGLNVPAGWGEPVFAKMEALLGAAFFSIGAVRAVEFGAGTSLATLPGSQANDPIGPSGPMGDLHGGILGGISTGKPIVARLFVRPTPSISLRQDTVDLQGVPSKIVTHGRHDPTVAPRLAPVAEAMCLIVLADLYLERQANIALHPQIYRED
jgi:chorismate synthase